jgi:hypothetical protein
VTKTLNYASCSTPIPRKHADKIKLILNSCKVKLHCIQMVHGGVHWQDFVKAMVKYLFHENRKFWPVATVLWLRRLDAVLSWRRTGFSPKSVHMRFFEGTALLEKRSFAYFNFPLSQSFCHFFIPIHLSPTLWFYQVIESLNNTLVVTWIVVNFSKKAPNACI